MDLPDDLDLLRRHHPLQAAPPVPADWKPGLRGFFFGPRKPWGDYAQARALIRHGRIAEARELLERLIAVARAQTDWQAEVLICLESLRPPAGLSPPQALWIDLPMAEKDALLAIKRFTTIDYKKLQDCLQKTDQASPHCPEGAAVLLMAFVATSDLALQVQLLFRNGRSTVGGMIVISPLKGLGFLLNRQHDESWAHFMRGVRSPESIIATYKEALKITIASASGEFLSKSFSDYCRIGLGLVLFDLGFDAERRAYFKSLVPDFVGGVAQACQMLA